MGLRYRMGLLLLAIALVTRTAPAGEDAAKAKDAPKAAPDKDKPGKKASGEPAPVKLGLILNEPKAYPGYTVLAPFDSSSTFLLDMQGKVVHTWNSDTSPALFPILMENGHLLRPGSIGNDSRVFGPGPGVGGRIQEFTWEGELVWDYQFYGPRLLPHHDMIPDAERERDAHRLRTDDDRREPGGRSSAGDAGRQLSDPRRPD